MGIFLCKNVHAGTFGDQEVGSGQRSVVGGEQGNEEEGFDGVHKTNDFGTKVEKNAQCFSELLYYCIIWWIRISSSASWVSPHSESQW